jgi:hypothetical protein
MILLDAILPICAVNANAPLRRRAKAWLVPASAIRRYGF